MADQWFYSHEGVRLGPCSARQLKELAASGGLLPTDTVWRQGTPQGVPAHRVKNLFVIARVDTPGSEEVDLSRLPATAPVSTAIPPAIASYARPLPPDARADRAEVPTERPSELAEDAMAPTTLAADAAGQTPGQPPAQSRQGQPQPRKKARALAVKGAIIVSQDGTRVRYRKKCTVCGFEESNRSSMLIRRGQIRAGFFCPTCRKNRPVVIQGITQ